MDSLPFIPRDAQSLIRGDKVDDRKGRWRTIAHVQRYEPPGRLAWIYVRFTDGTDKTYRPTQPVWMHRGLTVKP